MIYGVFASPEAAERSRAALLADGVAAPRITISRALTEDGVAAEAPGQNYENQPGQRTGHTSHIDDVFAAGAVLSVEPLSEAEEVRIAETLLGSGARRVYGGD